MKDPIAEFRDREQDVALDLDYYLSSKTGEKCKTMSLPYYLRFLTYENDDGASVMMAGTTDSLVIGICNTLNYVGTLIVEPQKWLPAFEVAKCYDQRHGTHYAENQVAYLKKNA